MYCLLSVARPVFELPRFAFDFPLQLGERMVHLVLVLRHAEFAVRAMPSAQWVVRNVR